MQLFADYIHPITNWLYQHPHWALLFTFFISFSESLAIIGSIVPGSVTMTAVGILAGSGVMRIDLTLLAAIFGAIAGDSASYFLGYYFSDRLARIWPFSRHPQLLVYGKHYFEKHGGKSVLIGRFAGPLRAVIPVIAGMMHMQQWRFLLANALSAVGWAILYVMPGILIGAASSDLSAEVATNLFVVVLVAIIAIWLGGIGIKYLLRKTNVWLSRNLHHLWSSSRSHPLLSKFVHFLTPEFETNHYATVSLLLIFCLGAILFVVLCLLLDFAHWPHRLNDSIHYFFQSLRGRYFDLFFATISFAYAPITLIGIASSISIMTILVRKYRLLQYWAITIISCLLLSSVLKNCIYSPYPTGTLSAYNGNSFPSVPLSTMVAMMCFSGLFLSRNITSWHAVVYRHFISIIIFFALVSNLYLGIHWLSDVVGSLLIGVCCAIASYILYRRKPFTRSIRSYWSLLTILIWIGGISLSAHLNLNDAMVKHKLIVQEHHLDKSTWWNQNGNSIPHFRKNRLGKPVNVFNIQFAGNLKVLEDTLQQLGWDEVNKTIWHTLLDKMNTEGPQRFLPILTQLHQNRKPILIMIPKADRGNLVLRAWRSEYVLLPSSQPLYFISISPNQSLTKKTADFENNIERSIKQALHSIAAYSQKNWDTRTMTIDLSGHKQWLNGYPNMILLIKERP